VSGQDVLLTAFDFAQYPKNTAIEVYVPHAIVTPAGALLLVAQTLGQYTLTEVGEDEEPDDTDYTRGYLICGHVPPGRWLWADPEKRANAARPPPPVEAGTDTEGSSEEENVVQFSPKGT
jgi:hypothetical protein